MEMELMKTKVGAGFDRALDFVRILGWSALVCAVVFQTWYFWDLRKGTVGMLDKQRTAMHNRYVMNTRATDGLLIKLQALNNKGVTKALKNFKWQQ